MTEALVRRKPMDLNAAYNLTQPIAWMGIWMQLPQDWQPIRHSLNPARGTLVLVDRRRQCMELGWKRLEKTPDLQHMLDDYVQQIRQEDRDAQFESLSVDQDRWQGIVRLDADDQTVQLLRAVSFNQETLTLLEVTLVGTALPTEAFEWCRQLLAQVRVEEDGQVARRWRMFDVDVEAMENWRLSSVQADVGHASFGLTRYDQTSRGSGKPTRDQMFIRRYGMAEVMYRGDLQRFLKLRNQGMTIEQQRALRHRGFEAATVIGIEPGKRLKRFTGQLRRQRDLVFRVPKENAMYHVSVLTSGDDAAVEPDQLKLRIKSDHITFLDRSIAKRVASESEVAR